MTEVEMPGEKCLDINARTVMPEHRCQETDPKRKMPWNEMTWVKMTRVKMTCHQTNIILFEEFKGDQFEYSLKLFILFIPFKNIPEAQCNKILHLVNWHFQQ